MGKHSKPEPKPKPQRPHREYIAPDGKSGAVTSSPSKKSIIDRILGK